MTRHACKICMCMYVQWERQVDAECSWWCYHYGPVGVQVSSCYGRKDMRKSTERPVLTQERLTISNSTLECSEAWSFSFFVLFLHVCVPLTDRRVEGRLAVIVMEDIVVCFHLVSLFPWSASSCLSFYSVERPHPSSFSVLGGHANSVRFQDRRWHDTSMVKRQGQKGKKQDEERRRSTRRGEDEEKSV